MKKLLQINVVSNTGSTGRIAEDIGSVIIENGWKSYIAYGRYGNPSKSKLIKIGNKWDNYWHVLISRLFDKHGFGSKRATLKLLRRIDTIEPDIIHLHNIHGYYININILFEYLRKKNIPVVMTMHDCWIFTGHCTYFSSINCQKWKSSCEKCPQKKVYPSSWILDNSKNNFNKKKKIFNSINMTLVPVSKWLSDLTKKSFIINSDIQVINNGIDLNSFNFKEYDYSQDKFKIKDKFVILGVASLWTKRKGLNDFIELSKRITGNEIIILVGLDKSQIKLLPKNIIGIEKTESIEELAHIYSMSNVFVNPTYEDNFPTTNLEALACGSPVITYNTGGSPEAINEDTGFVIQQGDFKALYEKIQIIKTNGKEFYKENCIKRANNNFDKKDRYKDYLNLYNNLLHKKH